MDLSAQFDEIIKEMEWDEVIDTVKAMVDDIVGEMVKPAPFIPLETQSQTAVIEPAQVNSQRQFLPYQLPQPIVPGGAASTSAPTAQHHNMSVTRLSGAMMKNMVPIGKLNGEVVYSLPGVPPVPPAAPPVQGQRLCKTMMKKMVPIGELNGVKVYGLPRVPLVPPAAPPVTTSKSQPEDDVRPHVKKPLNAFMIFRKKHSSNVAAELSIKNSASVNTVLGQMWQSMSAEEKSKYYEEAEMEKMNHILEYPHWSYCENYGKKRKRVRRKAPATAEASEAEVTQRDKRTCRTPVETAPMEAPPHKSSSLLPHSPLLTVLPLSPLRLLEEILP